MINSIEAGRTYFIEATGPYGLEEDLNAAVDAVLEQAIKDGRYGILVTRHGHTTFTVVASSKVPYGQIFEESGPAWTARSAEGPDSGGS